MSNATTVTVNGILIPAVSTLYLTADIFSTKWSFLVFILSLGLGYSATQLGLGFLLSSLFPFLGVLAVIKVQADRFRNNNFVFWMKILFFLSSIFVVYYYNKQGDWAGLVELLTKNSHWIAPLLLIFYFFNVLTTIANICFCVLPAIGFLVSMSHLFEVNVDYYDIFIKNPWKLLLSNTWSLLLQNSLLYLSLLIVGCSLLKETLRWIYGYGRRRNNIPGRDRDLDE
jgi:hypothetical protein